MFTLGLDTNRGIALFGELLVELLLVENCTFRFMHNGQIEEQSDREYDDTLRSSYVITPAAYKVGLRPRAVTAYALHTVGTRTSAFGAPSNS